MSKKIKASSKAKNLQAKRARKAANTARYAALRAAGKNCKSKRSVKAGKKSRRLAGVEHSTGYCGNTGCIRCFPYVIMKFRKKLYKP